MTDATAATPAARPAPAGGIAVTVGRLAIVGLPYLWLLFLFLLPFAIVLKLSFSTSEIAQPPYSPVFHLADFADGLSAGLRIWAGKLGQFTVANYQWLAQNDLYLRAYLSSLEIAVVSTILVLLAAYPIAYGMSRAPGRWRPTLLMLVILPFWTSFLIRVYAWIGILKPEGLLNQLLQSVGLITDPLIITNTNWAVYIGIVYSYLPFMILPLYAALERQDDTLLEAAADLGSPPFRSFWQVTFPLSLPGVIAGSLLVFIPVMGEYVIPELLGGSNTLMIGKTLADEFSKNHDWPLASAVAVILILILVVPIVYFQNQSRRAEGGLGL